MPLLPDWSPRRQADYCHQLLNAGLVERHDDGLKASRRWQAAMARSALSLLKHNESMQDERLAVVISLRSILNPIPDDHVLCDLVLLMQFVEHVPVNNLGRFLDGA